MNIRGHMRIPPLEAEAHRFSVGQLVRMKGRLGVIPKTDEIFRITGTLPARDNILQYRLRSDGEIYERVAAEDNLELVGAEASTVVEVHSSSSWTGSPSMERAAAAKGGLTPTRAKTRR